MFVVIAPPEILAAAAVARDLREFSFTVCPANAAPPTTELTSAPDGASALTATRCTRRLAPKLKREPYMTCWLRCGHRARKFDVDQ